jgi:hypothetical protein
MCCEVVLRWDATPGQRKALGAALWGWCSREAGGAGIYQCLDNQPLADLLAGAFPAPGAAPGAGLPQVTLSVRGVPARDREGVLESLRRALPGAGVSDVRVDGTSWRRAGAERRACQP